ncbi:ATP-binding protein [Stutzerimonas chloritidismutans]|uniref:ATP-binding protein n=1 Tax=Stutzerimonas chloritidismutans TaxID=203192 RepID=UPI003F177FDB
MTPPLDYKAIFQAVPNLHLVLAPDPEFTILAASDAQLRATNTRREESVGRPVFEVFRKNPDDPEDFGTAVLRASLERVRCTRTADSMAITKYDIPRPADQGGGFEVRYWKPLNVPVLGENGELRYIIHQVEDVTAEVLSQQGTLGHLDERFRAALLASGTGTFNWYPDDNSLHLDSALAQMLRLPLHHQADTFEHFFEQIHHEDRQSVREAFQRYANGHDHAVEFRLARSGPEQWLACKARAFRDADRHLSYVAGACTNISARKHAEEALRVSEQRMRQLNETLEARVAAEVAERSRTEEALRQAQKMEAVGQLTGGIAHDFNNLLTGIIGSLDLMQRRYSRGDGQEVERYINAAVTSAQRAAALTQRLLAFSRRQTLDLKPVDVNRLVASLEDLLRRTTGENVTVVTDLSAGLQPACMDVNQLESALLNLVINARDAMPHGGRITVTTRSYSKDATPDPKRRGLSEGDYVLLSVTDTGSGMTDEIIERAFEPFFTTKPIGQGTGLGLSMVYGYIKQAKGYIHIDSEPGRGTSVSLFLPVHHGDTASPTAEAEQTPRGTGETILIVEDEPVVRGLVVEVLDDLGYQTLEAGDATEALPIIESPQRIDLLISDVGLPGMNGRQLAEFARLQRPGLKILFATGYAESATSSEFLDTDMALIAKPFAIDAFATKVGEMLGAQTGR